MSSSDFDVPGTCAQCGKALPMGHGEVSCPACLFLGVATVTAGSSDDPTLTGGGSQARPFPDLEPGVIGSYRLLEQLGEGGFGIVWRAEQAEPIRREVALKVIKPGMDSKEVIARFEAERQALALMGHPNIAAVLDAGTTDSGHPYFVMELVKGVPITTYCDEHRLTIRQRLELFIPVCQAVQHAHQKAILHRDLKPSNILVMEVDGRPVPKVIDFGIAKALGADHELLPGGSLARTLEGMLIGTPQYMSPEQAGSVPDVDTRSDIYTLGVILYELLTGRSPLDVARLRQAVVDEICRIIREEEPPRPSTTIRQMDQATASEVAQRRGTETTRRWTGEVRGELDWIVMMALEKERERRYPTASALAQDIERYLKQEPVAAGPPQFRYRARKFLRRHRVPIVSIFSFVMCSAVAGFYHIRRIQTEKTAAVNALQAAKSARIAEAEQRSMAERSRHAAEVIVNRTIFDLRDALEPIGRLDLLDAVSMSVESYFLDLPMELRDHSSERNRAAMLDFRGDVLSAQGKTDGALRLFREGLDIRQRLAEAQGASAPRKRELVVSYNKLGDSLKLRGDSEGAYQAYQSSLKLSEELVRLDPSEADWQKGILRSCLRVGGLLQERGDSIAARDMFQRSLKVARSLAMVDTSNLGQQRQLSVCLERMGDIYVILGSTTNADQMFSEALAISERVVAAEPTNLKSKEDLAWGYIKSGEVRLMRGDVAPALELFRQALALRRASAADNSTDMGAQLRLAWAHLKGGDALMFRGDFEEASAAYASAQVISQRLLQVEPENAEWSALHAWALNKSGEVKESRGDYAGAEKILQESAEHFRRLSTLNPANKDYLDDLSSVLCKLGRVLVACGKLEEARERLAEGLCHISEIASVDPENLLWKEHLAFACRWLGKVALTSGDLAQAKLLISQADNLCARLVKQDAANVEWTSALAATKTVAGDLARVEGGWPLALKCWQEARKLVAGTEPSVMGNISEYACIYAEACLAEATATATMVPSDPVALRQLIEQGMAPLLSLRKHRSLSARQEKTLEGLVAALQKP